MDNSPISRQEAALTMQPAAPPAVPAPARWIYLAGWLTATVMGAVAIASLVGGVAG